MRLHSISLLVILLCWQAVAARDRHLPSNEEASCPRRCVCDRTNVVCRNTKLREDVFKQIHKLSFPYLETLVMIGNNLQDISENIFEDGETHASLSLMNLTDDRIQKISPLTFKSTPNVEYLHLAENQILSAGKNTFGNLQRLRRLDMKNSLGSRSASSKADLLSLMFETEDRSSFPELSEIVLSHNEISKLHPDTFCKISGLVRLDLSYNMLTSFELAPNCLQQIKALDLSGNKFATFTPALWDSMPRLTTLDISRNPINCDCGLQPFVDIIKSEHSDFTNQGLTLCAAPDRMKDKNIFDYGDSLCAQKGYGWGTFIILGVIAGAALFAYRHYRRRRPVTVPFQFGYTGLEAEEDVQPEFV